VIGIMGASCDARGLPDPSEERVPTVLLDEPKEWDRVKVQREIGGACRDSQEGDAERILWPFETRHRAAWPLELKPQSWPWELTLR